MYDEQLLGIQNSIRMAKPVTARLKGLRKKETELEKAKTKAEEIVVSTRDAANVALRTYEDAKSDLETTSENLPGIQDQVAQASLEKIDYDASKLGQQASKIVVALGALAEQ